MEIENQAREQQFPAVHNQGPLWVDASDCRYYILIYVMYYCNLCIYIYIWNLRLYTLCQSNIVCYIILYFWYTESIYIYTLYLILLNSMLAIWWNYIPQSQILGQATILTKPIHVLVGGFKHILFSIIYGLILPIDELIFFRWVGTPPTSDILVI